MSAPSIDRAILYGEAIAAIANEGLAHTLNTCRADDELRRTRTAALSLATDVARDRTGACGTHPGADAILATAAAFCDFIWNGAKS